jgi:hypothetical protein
MAPKRGQTEIRGRAPHDDSMGARVAHWVNALLLASMLFSFAVQLFLPRHHPARPTKPVARFAAITHGASGEGGTVSVVFQDERIRFIYVSDDLPVALRQSATVVQNGRIDTSRLTDAVIVYGPIEIKVGPLTALDSWRASISARGGVAHEISTLTNTGGAMPFGRIRDVYIVGGGISQLNSPDLAGSSMAALAILDLTVPHEEQRRYTLEADAYDREIQTEGDSFFKRAAEDIEVVSRRAKEVKLEP